MNAASDAQSTRPPPDPDLQVLRLVAHELRAHLTVLNGWSALLLEDARVRDDPERREHALGEMRAHLATLTDLAAHLAGAVGGGGHAQLPVVIVDVDLGGAAREALAMVADVARRHRVRLHLDDGGLGEAPVRGDRFQLVVAMRNLVDNACAHGPDGEAVTLEVGRSDGDVVIRTHDQGGGIGGLGRRAFKPRRRRRRQPQEGLGLGLSLVAEVARAHGGRVTWSREGQEATVGLRFPDRASA